jgi:Glycine zipper
MKTTKKKTKGASKNPAEKGRLAHEAEGAASGAVAGAALGSAAGPPGIVAGAILGGVAGAVTGAVLDREGKRKGSRDRELDAEIGVSGGELGAPNLEHPPAKVGAYSASSSGAAPPSSGDVAEGPIQPPEK